MSTWLVGPRDPLVVRDGRPNNGRSRSTTLPFPLPSTTAGGARSRLGLSPAGRFEVTDLDALRRSAMRGPLLYSREKTGAAGLLVPAPRDCVLFDDNRAWALAPQPCVGLVDTAFPTELLPLGLCTHKEGKPPPDVAAWWSWRGLEAWLTKSIVARDGQPLEEFAGDGQPRLATDSRMHVSIDGGTLTGIDGRLFPTEGLVFATKDRRSLAMWLDVGACEANGTRVIRPGVAPLAAERRLVHWEATTENTIPDIPNSVVAHVKTGDAPVVRVVLLTPALFTAGWRPADTAGGLLESRSGVTPTLVAAIVPRPETTSGWDMEKNRPRKSRRLVPAGSVYWLKLVGDATAREAWLRSVWMQNVSDEGQDRNDGFGLAVVGVGP